jgi:Bacterial protein of unknown function (DUF916)
MLGRRLAIVTLFLVLAAIAAPAAAFAGDGQVKLALQPVGQTRSYFDLTMRPGETRALHVVLSNTGDTPTIARTYAADVYTIVNGGFGGRLYDEPQTGTTRWLDYPTGGVTLPVGRSTRRSFSVAVPTDARPGEYITSLILESDQPIQGGSAVTLNQVVRQAVGVVVTVPGRRSPGLSIGAASQTVVGGSSVVSVALANTGNIRLKPVAAFVLFDSAGSRISDATVPMGTFYAHTTTSVEVPLAQPLQPGTYTVRLTLEDAIQGAQAEATGITFTVVAPVGGVQGGGVVPGLTGVDQGIGVGQISLPLWFVLLGGALLLVGVFGVLILVLRRGRPAAP